MLFERTSYKDGEGNDATRPLSQRDAEVSLMGGTHASDDLEKFLRVGLWEAPYGIHLVNVERHGTCTELLNEQVADEIIVVGEVAHVHDLGGAPDKGGRALGDMLVGGSHRRRGRGGKTGGVVVGREEEKKGEWPKRLAGGHVCINASYVISPSATAQPIVALPRSTDKDAGSGRPLPCTPRINHSTITVDVSTVSHRCPNVSSQCPAAPCTNIHLIMTFGYYLPLDL